MNTYQEITRCRICGNERLEPVIHLGEQQLTGVFPKNKDQKISSGPLSLVKCHQEKNDTFCGLLQLQHSFSNNEMYCQNYGYRSGLNLSMVKHLGEIALEIKNRIQLYPGDIIIDIGSNDATLLKFFETTGAHLIGIDPGGDKFSKYYTKNIHLVGDFFPSPKLNDILGNKKAKAITSIAMFYDLDAPLHFMVEISRILDDNGIWVFEQSYLPDMLRTNSYDTICHEHKEYYALSQIKWMTDQTGLSIVNVSTNNTNGGSFRVTVTKNKSMKEVPSLVRQMLLKEKETGLNEMQIYNDFGQKIKELKNNLCALIQSLNKGGEKVLGYGASTKGNVLLQYCGLTKQDIPFIADVNEDKWGAFTPATQIPIISEAEAKKMNPDYFLVLPWHFRDFILEKETEFTKKGGKFIFPFPEVEIV